MAPAKKKQKLSNGSVASLSVSDGIEEQETAANESNAQAQEDSQQQRRSLFIRSLPASTTSDILTSLFSESYPVKHATAVIDPATKQCRGYGFVTFADAEDAQRAREEFNGHTLDGRKLRVEVAEPRHREVGGAQGSESEKVKQTKKIQDIPQPSRLIVRNLPWTIKTSDHLAKIFMSYGKIKHAYIPKTGSGRMAGFGFVVLRGRKNAEKALEGVNGKNIDGRTLAVDWAVSKDVYDDLLNRGTGDADDEAVGTASGASGLDLAKGSGEDESDDESVVSEDQDDAADNEDDDFEDDEDEDEDEGVDVRPDEQSAHDLSRREDKSTTVFVRNLPFTCTDEDLEDQFASFGKTRYARVVMDPNTERSKGTGFVCFYNKPDADACVRGAPKQTMPSATAESKDAVYKQTMNSVLQNQDLDPTGRYTIDGRILQVSRAVGKTEANRLTEEGAVHRRKRNEDKRRLYLLSEGTISSNSKLWEKLSPTERNMREASAKQRKTLIESNPSLHLSLTRLSVRNIPRSVTSKDLKALAREAVVGFATDVKAGTRQKLSKEELARSGEDMNLAEKARKQAGKGVVKQAKIVFEGVGGGKVEESTGAGKSRGYGFIEYYTHRNTLMGLRWLNGHAVGYQVRDEKKGRTTKEQLEDRKKRLIVEFAIENAQVVMRRKDRENKEKPGGEVKHSETSSKTQADSAPGRNDSKQSSDLRKRKRESERPRESKYQNSQKTTSTKAKAPPGNPEDPQKKPDNEKIAKRNQIIGRKRAMRARRKGPKQ